MGGSGSGYTKAVNGNAKVLKIKQTTPSQSSRQVWDRVENAEATLRPAGAPRRAVIQPGAISYATNFPAPQTTASSTTPAPSNLATHVALKRERTRPTPTNAKTVPGSTAWASSQKANTPANFPSLPPPAASSSSSRPVPVSVNYASSTGGSSRSAANIAPSKPVSHAAFPSLQANSAAKEQAAQKKALFANPSKRLESIKRITGEKSGPVSSWGSTPSGSGTTTPEPVGGAGSGGKKKGKGKEVLFTISTRPT